MIPAVTADSTADAARELDDGTVELTLDAALESAGRARAYVRERWNHLDDNVIADVELIVSELVSNAIEYGAPEICLRLRAKPFAVDVAVLDHGVGWPQRQESDGVLRRSRGRGLAIVDRLSAAWGVDPLPDEQTGKIVWASIDRV